MSNCKECPCKERDPTKENTVEFTGLTMPETIYTAICILNGLYGNGEERVNNLKKIYTESYIKEAQNIVNVLAEFWD